MATEMRKTGIDVVGDTPWGTHFCLFYETKEDILDTLVPYWKAGLEGQEFCVWVIAKPLREEDARHALKQAMPDLDRYLADGSIEMVSAEDWYLQGGKFDLERVLAGWHEKLASALARGYAGMRVTGDTVWLQKDDWKDFCEYEDAINLSFANQRLTLLCSYPLAACGAAEILDVARTHQFAVAKRHGGWEVVETPSIKQAKAEIKQLNEELEHRVMERTSQLTAVNEELRMEIRERERAERALRESETRYRDIFDTVGVSIWEEDLSQLKAAIDDLKGQGVDDFRRYLAANPEFVHQAIPMVNVVDVNEMSVRLFAAEGKEELRVSLERVFVPETEEVFAEEMIAIADGRTSFEAETVLQTLKGKRLTVLLTITFPPPWARFDSVLVTVKDITERKQAEYLTEQIFETSPDSFCIVGRDYRFKRVNRATAIYFGRPAEQIVGLHIADQAGTEVFERQMKPWFDRCFAGEEVSHAGWVVHRLGRRYLRTTCSPLRPQSQGVEAGLMISRDFTEYALASEALREAQAELAHVTRVATLGELTAALAHEINQPLSGVAINANTCLRWLELDPPNLDEAREAVRRVERDGKRANEVIARIRALTRKDPPAMGRVDINDAIRDVVALAQGELRGSRVAPRMELADDLLPVLGDRVQLQQVVLNLVMNGIEAMATAAGERRELVISTQASGAEQVRVAVRDAGVGLDPQNIDRLFEAFYTTKSSGMGMGLSISRTIVTSHGGRLWAVANDGPGATFQFTVPRYDEMR